MRVFAAPFLALALFLPDVFPAPLAAASASISGEVTVKGRIVKLKGRTKKFNPYGAVYKSDKPAAELEQQLLVYLDGYRAAAVSDIKDSVLGQKDRNFTSSIVPVRAGGHLSITNQDTVKHHIRSETKPWAFNLKPRSPGDSATPKAPSGKELDWKAPPEGGLGIVPVYCDIHPHMRAHVLVIESDKYELLPEAGGKFSLKGLPAGTYTVSAWHPTLKAEPVKVTVKAGEAKRVKLVMLGKQD